VVYFYLFGLRFLLTFHLTSNISYKFCNEQNQLHLDVFLE